MKIKLSKMELIKSKKSLQGPSQADTGLGLDTNLIVKKFMASKDKIPVKH